MGEKLFRGQILDFLEDPGVTETTLEALRYLEDGALVTGRTDAYLRSGLMPCSEPSIPALRFTITQAA